MASDLHELAHGSSARACRHRRARVSARTLALSLLLGAACASTHPAARPPAPIASRSGAPPRVASSLPTPPARAPAPAPPAWHPVDARLLPTAFAVRVRFHDSAPPAAAPDWFLAPIFLETHVGTGVVFVTADGLVSVAPSDLATPRPLGTVPSPPEHLPDSRGRAAILDAHGRLWTTDGTAPVSRVEGLPATRVLSAAFFSREFGVAVLADGAVWQTLDGGAHWREVDLHGDRANELDPRDQGLAIQTGSGWQLLLPSGERTATTAPALARPPEQDDAPRDTSPVYEHYVRGFAPALFDGPERLIVADVDNGIVLLDARTGAVLARGDVEFDGDGLRRWGAGFASYRSYRYGASLHRLGEGEDEETFSMGGDADPGLDGELEHRELATRYRVAREVLRSALLSSDGVHAAAVGTGCATETRRALCALLPRGDEHDRWRTIPLQEPAARGFAMHGEDVLLSVGPRPNGDALRIVNVGTGRTTRVELPSSAHGLAGVLSADWLPDGQLAVRAAPERVLLGPARGPWREVRLPQGTVGVAFVDDRHAIASGGDLAHLWRTRDGGATFENVHVAARGDVAGVRLDGSVVCDGPLCTIGGAVLASADGPIPGAEQNVIGAVNGTPSAPAPAGAERAEMVGLLCTSRPALRGSEFNPEVRDGSPEPSHLAGRGARGELTFTTAPDGAAVAHLRWQGSDANGSYDVRTDAPIPPSRLDQLEGHFDHALLLAMGEGAVLSRCRGELGEDRACQTLWASPGRGLVSVEVGREPTNAIARPDGGAAILFGRDQAPGVAVAIDASGEQVARATGVAVEGLARLAGDVGLVTSDPDSPGSVRFVPLRARASAMVLPWRDRAIARACEGAPATGAMVVRRSDRFMSVRMGDFAFEHNFEDQLVEVVDGVGCVRSLDATGWWNPSPGFGIPVVEDDEVGAESVHLEARHGRLVGTSETVRHVQLSCSVR